MYESLIPRVGVYYPYYNFNLLLDLDRLNGSILNNSEVNFIFYIWCDGKLIFENKKVAYVDNDANFINSQLEFKFGNSKKYVDKIGFYELIVESANKEKIFFDQSIEFTSYGNYWKKDHKSFMAEVSYKFSDPRVILQIENFKEYIQTYASVHIDIEKNLDESLAVVNPYMSEVRINIKSENGKLLKNIIIPGQSAFVVRLNQLLINSNIKYIGSIQIYTKHRIIPFIIKHLYKNNMIIVDHEHLDWFQPSESKGPLTLLIRRKLGSWLGR